ncbi:MAG: DctP family TRAP transporter solute-binding subunit [Magnetococcales bacterium]|nr:DctP family TRAP transporter solute-binding subunit [Magnetococcales bacterium]
MTQWKKLVLGVLFLVLSVVLVCWLARSSLSPPSDNRKQNPATATIRLRFGHNSPVDSALHVAAQRFADDIARKTNGKVQVTVYPFQELGNDDQMLEMARQGRLDILLTPTAKMSVAIPAMQYADLPFYFPSREALYHMLDGEPGRLLLGKLHTIGLQGIAFWENGFKHFTANRPIHDPDDFKGLKIRTMKSRIIMDHFDAMGAVPILIDFHVTRQALADKVVDGEENPLVAIVGMKFYQVQSHLTLSSHGYLGYVLSTSAKVLQNLPPDIRSLIMATGRELVPFEREETQRREKQFLETIRQAGVTIHNLTEAERRRFTQNAAHIVRQFESVIGSDILSKTEESLRFEQPIAESNNDIVIGFDSDLSNIGVRASLGIKQGALLAMEEINRSGGVLGKKLVLISRDNRAMPSSGLRNFQDLASNPQVVAILGGVFSSISEVQSKEAQRLGIPYLVPWGAAASIVEDCPPPSFTFRVSANDRLAGPFLAGSAIKRFDKVALVLENSSWGRGNLDAMGSFLNQVGHPPVQVVWMNRGENDAASILRQVRASGAKGIILVANTREGAGLIKAMLRDKIDGQTPLPIISHWGIVSGDLWHQVGAVLSEIDLQVLQTFSFANTTNPQTHRVLESYKKIFYPHERETEKDFLPSPVGISHAYDFVHLLALAIAKAGNTVRSDIRDALEHLDDYRGLIKHYVHPFTPEHHDALDVEDYFLTRFNQNGHLVAGDR